MTYIKTYYQNPDLTIAYTITCPVDGVIASGGAISAEAVLLETADDIDNAEALIAESVANTRDASQQAADDAEAVRVAEVTAIAQALVDGNVLTVEQAESFYGVDLQ